MRELLQELMANNSRIIIFIHVLSAIFWIGGMLVLKLGVQPSLKNISDPKIRLARALEIMNRFFLLVILAIVLLLVTAVIMIIGWNIKEVNMDMYRLIIYKEIVWGIMSIIFGFIVFKRHKAEQCFVLEDMQGAKENIAIIDKVIYVNIFLGLLALYMGVMLTGH